MPRLGWTGSWPFYLGEHRDARNRALHAAGTSLALALLVSAVVSRLWWLSVVALASGYALAWVGHFVFEKNRPATFRYPIKSFCMDWRMWALTLTGRIRRECERHGIP